MILPTKTMYTSENGLLSQILGNKCRSQCINQLLLFLGLRLGILPEHLGDVLNLSQIRVSTVFDDADLVVFVLGNFPLTETVVGREFNVVTGFRNDESNCGITVSKRGSCMLDTNLTQHSTDVFGTNLGQILLASFRIDFNGPVRTDNGIQVDGICNDGSETLLLCTSYRDLEIRKIAGQSLG